MKALLAIRALDPGVARGHVVAEITAEDNARTIRAVTDGRVLTASSDRIVAEVTAQARLQSGLAAVFADLLDFDGDEIYFTDLGELAGAELRGGAVGLRIVVGDRSLGLRRQGAAEPAVRHRARAR